MAKTAQEIVDAIYAHLNEQTNFSDFYIGITNDIERRLFGEHRVPKAKGTHWWIYNKALSENHARNVEKYFIGKGMQGGTGGGDTDCVWVYCYKISNSTIE